MKIHTWLPAAGLLVFGGMAAAQETAQEDGITEETKQAGEQAGEAVGQGIEEGASAVTGDPSKHQRGILRDGDRVRNTITTDPVGLVTGDGLNATYARSLTPKFSGLVGARYSQAQVVAGSLTSFGVNGGVDYYILGQHNEGLRIGPRLEVGFARQAIAEDATTAGIGLAGEVAYDWIASNGLTAGAGAGLQFELGGNLEQDVETDWRPYGKINLGYSW